MNKVLENLKKGFNVFIKYHVYVMVILFAIDMISKFVMEDILLKHGTIVVIKNFFAFELVYNPGSFSGFLGGIPGGTFILMCLSILGAVAAIYYLTKKYFTMNKIIRVALYLLIPGCIGNLVDRFLKVIGVTKGVIDFLSFNLPLIGPFPVFNFADICLTVSMFMIIFALIYEEIKKEKNKKEVTEDKSVEEMYKEESDKKDGK